MEEKEYNAIKILLEFCYWIIFLGIFSKYITSNFLLVIVLSYIIASLITSLTYKKIINFFLKQINNIEKESELDEKIDNLPQIVSEEYKEQSEDFKLKNDIFKKSEYKMKRRIIKIYQLIISIPIVIILFGIIFRVNRDFCKALCIIIFINIFYSIIDLIKHNKRRKESQKKCEEYKKFFDLDNE